MDECKPLPAPPASAPPRRASTRACALIPVVASLNVSNIEVLMLSWDILSGSRTHDVSSTVNGMSGYGGRGKSRLVPPHARGSVCVLIEWAALLAAPRAGDRV